MNVLHSVRFAGKFVEFDTAEHQAAFIAGARWGRVDGRFGGVDIDITTGDRMSEVAERVYARDLKPGDLIVGFATAYDDNARIVSEFVLGEAKLFHGFSYALYTQDGTHEVTVGTYVWVKR